MEKLGLTLHGFEDLRPGSPDTDIDDVQIDPAHHGDELGHLFEDMGMHIDFQNLFKGPSPLRKLRGISPNCHDINQAQQYRCSNHSRHLSCYCRYWSLCLSSKKLRNPVKSSVLMKSTPAW